MREERKVRKGGRKEREQQFKRERVFTMCASDQYDWLLSHYEVFHTLSGEIEIIVLRKVRKLNMFIFSS